MRRMKSGLYVLVSMLLLLSFGSKPFAEDVARVVFETPHAELRGLGQQPLETTRAFYAAYRTQGVSYPAIDPDLSLFVRQDARLAGLTFERIMTKLAADTGTDAEALFRQFWANLKHGDANPVSVTEGCANKLRLGLLSRSFPLDCDTYLAGLAGLEHPFVDAKKNPTFKVIAAVNRIDLKLPGDCGEYRLIVAADPNWLGATQYVYGRDIYLIFEATLPERGEAERCVAIQRYWARLSQMQDADIAAALERFYFTGVTLTATGELADPASCATPCYDIGPVIDAANMTWPTAPGDRPGQVRLNANTGTTLWSLREFKFEPMPPRQLLPVPIANTPDYSTLSDASPYVQAMSKAVLGQAGALSSATFAGLAFKAPIETYANQQMANSQFGKFLLDPYSDAIGTVMEDAFCKRAMATGLSRKTLVNRLTLLSCAGCHRLSNLGLNKVGFSDMAVWPGSIDFTHISADRREAVDGQYMISDALIKNLLPLRKAVMEAVIGVEPPTHPMQ